MIYEFKKLSELADISVGFAFKSEGFNTDGKGIRLVRGKNITRLSLRWGDDARWWNDFSIDLKRYLLKADDIVIGMDGSLVGKNYAKVRESDLPLLLVQRVACIRSKEGIDQNFIWNCISSSRFEQYVDSVKTGTSIPHISGKQIGEYLIPNFPYEKQKEISAILSSLENKIELNQRINDNLQQQAQAIYMSRFTDTNGCLADICQYSKEKIFVSKLTLDNYYSTENMLSEKGGSVQAASLPTMTQTTRCCPGDVLVSNIRPYFKKIVYCVADGGCSTDVLCFAPKEKNLSEYLFYTLYADRFFDYMVAGSKGTKMPRGDKQQIMTYPIYIPSDVELTDYNSIAQPILTKIEKNREENLRLATLKDVLLPKLMSGEINTQKKNTMWYRKVILL